MNDGSHEMMLMMSPTTTPTMATIPIMGAAAAIIDATAAATFAAIARTIWAAFAAALIVARAALGAFFMVCATFRAFLAPWKAVRPNLTAPPGAFSSMSVACAAAWAVESSPAMRDMTPSAPPAAPLYAPGMPFVALNLKPLTAPFLANFAPFLAMAFGAFLIPALPFLARERIFPRPAFLTVDPSLPCFLRAFARLAASEAFLAPALAALAPLTVAFEADTAAFDTRTPPLTAAALDLVAPRAPEANVDRCFDAWSSSSPPETRPMREYTLDTAPTGEEPSLRCFFAPFAFMLLPVCADADDAGPFEEAERWLVPCAITLRISCCTACRAGCWC